MKKVLLALTLLLTLGFAKTNAQIINNDFENWKLDTFDFPAGTFGTLPADTITFNNPVGWTSSNFLTGLDSIGSLTLVTQSANSYSGTSAVQMTSDTIVIGQLTHLPFSKVVLPGFVISGSFPLTSISITGGSAITPASVPGAGQPFSQRLATFNGYYNYTPSYNPATATYDTCLLWATLRKGKNIIANAIFKSSDSTGGYRAFSANFQYLSCEVPDTLVVLMASGILSVQKFITIPRGSKLLVDSIYYQTLPGNYVFAPFAKNDVITAYKNTPDTINVLANDTDCSGTPPIVSINSGPNHGTASVVGNKVVYIPSNGFLGLDTIYYKDTNGAGDTADAIVVIFVTHAPSGISDVNQFAVSLYPNPANTELHVQFENPGKCAAHIYDMVGNIVFSTPLNNNNSSININSLANGLYGIQIVSEQNEVLARRMFVVTK